MTFCAAKAKKNRWGEGCGPLVSGEGRIAKLQTVEGSGLSLIALVFSFGLNGYSGTWPE